MHLMSRIISVLACAILTVVATAEPAEDAQFGTSAAPRAQAMKISKRQVRLAQEGRLGVLGPDAETVIPVQWESGVPTQNGCVVFLAPGVSGARLLKWSTVKTKFEAVMQVQPDPQGQIEIAEAGKPVLRYNYRAVEPGALLEKVSAGNRIYARARSDYIHPLHGLRGETLTRDWSIDHPHHRGIYWAWPEVDFGKERGDLHALQKVFARPTGQAKLQSGPVYAQIEAENQWVWEDREPVVRERVLIRAYRASAHGRLIDLAFKFSALKNGITLARRGTEAYGGLNIRMETPQGQTISTFTSPPGANPRRAWSDLSGVFGGAGTPSGLGVLQHRENPDYPGDWVQYPELSWCQPTFPAARTRYALAPGQPLVLRFRLWIHSTGQPDAERCSQVWDALHEKDAAIPLFTE